MLKKFKELLKKMKDKRIDRANMKSMKKYYKLLRHGAMFLEYIHKDIEKQKQYKLNRKQRRRFESDLEKKGQFNKDLISFYSNQVDDILQVIDTRLKNKKIKLT